MTRPEGMWCPDHPGPLDDARDHVCRLRPGPARVFSLIDGTGITGIMIDVRGGPSEERPLNGQGSPVHGSNPASRNPQVARQFSPLNCPQSVSGHAQNDGSGLCCWCGQRVDPPVRRPRLSRSYRTEADLEYRRTYDPDWGTDPYDV